MQNSLIFTCVFAQCFADQLANEHDVSQLLNLELSTLTSVQFRSNSHSCVTEIYIEMVSQ